MTEQELRDNLKQTIADAYMHEDDAQDLNEELKVFEEDSEEWNSTFAELSEAENNAQYYWSCVASDLEELSELVGYKVTVDDFSS